MIAIFGGTAAYHLDLADFAQVTGTTVAHTPHGDVTFTRLRAEKGTECLFISRHGTGKLARSARFVNHRAHVAAAAALGATGILSWNGVGAINPALAVGDLVVPDDVLDETRAREVAISNWRLEIGDYQASVSSLGSTPAGRRPLVSSPFDHELRGALLDSAISNLQSQSAGAVHSKGTYVCTEGPRLETPAEIAAFGRLGADVVGMTLCPEVWLAAEAGLPYASLCAVTNMAAGLAHLNPARDFGPGVGARCLSVCLGAVEKFRNW